MDMLVLNVVISFIVTFFLIRLFIAKASTLGLIDNPNDRSAHTVPIPRGAGIVFGFITLVGMGVFQYLHESYYPYAFIALFLVYLTGVYDDFYDSSARNKFIFIIIATVIAYLDGFEITSLGNYFGYELSLGYLTLPFTIFAVLGFTNAVNLSDGLDGLAGSISMIILSSLLYIGIEYDDVLLTCLPIIIISTLLAFLYFNWYPAKVFMGDSGSLFLGFTLSLLSIYALKYINPASILFLAAIPLLDTLIVMSRRKQRKQSLFVADKNHLHHILLNFKKNKLFTVYSLAKLQAVFGLIFIQVHDKSDTINLLLFAILFVIFFNLFDPRMRHRGKRK